MAASGYARAHGWDQDILTPIEDIITYAPKGKVIPLGSVRRKTLDKHIQTNGSKDISWFFGAMSNADFETLILDIFGDWDTENADLTIDTRGADNVFHRGNVVANRPVEGEDYTRQERGDVEGLTLTLRDFQEVGDSAFSTEFSFDFAS